MAASLALSAALAAAGGLVLARTQARAARAERAYPPVGRLLALPDRRRVHVAVSGSGPDLVLIHGASGNLRDFTFDFATRLASQFRVIAVDRPGLGHSDHAHPRHAGWFAAGGESPREQAAMLAAAVRELGVHRPVVLGHSYGAAVAMAWALERASAALVVVAGATQPWPGGLGPLYRMAGSALGGAALSPLIAAFAPRISVDAALRAVFAPQAVPAGYRDAIGADLALRTQAFRANARQVNTLRPHLVEMAPRYSGLDLPLEIVHGTADEIVPLAIHSEPLAGQVPGARLTRLDGVGHMPHHAAPEAVVAAVVRAAGRARLL